MFDYIKETPFTPWRGLSLKESLEKKMKECMASDSEGPGATDKDQYKEILKGVLAKRMPKEPPLPPEEATAVWAAGGLTIRWIVVRNADGSIAGTATVREGPVRTPMEETREAAREWRASR